MMDTYNGKNVYELYKELIFGKHQISIQKRKKRVTIDLGQVLSTARTLSDQEVLAAVEKILKLSIPAGWQHALTALIVTAKKDVVLTSKKKLSELTGKSPKTIERLLARSEGLVGVKVTPTVHGTVVDFRGILGLPDPSGGVPQDHASENVRQNNVWWRQDDAAIRQNDVAWRQDGATLRQNGREVARDVSEKNDVTWRQNDATMRQTDTTIRQNDATQSDATIRQNDATWRQDDAAIRQSDATMRQNDASLEKESSSSNSSRTTTTTTTTTEEKRSGAPLAPLLRAKFRRLTLPYYAATFELLGLDVDALSPTAHKKLLFLATDDFSTFVKKVYYIKKNAKNPNAYALKVLDANTDALLTLEEQTEAKKVADFVSVFVELFRYSPVEWLVKHGERAKEFFSCHDPEALIRKVSEAAKSFLEKYRKVSQICDQAQLSVV